MKYIYIIALTCLVLTSCDVLNQESSNSVEDSKVFTTREGAEAALIGLYSSMQVRDYYGGYYPMIADLYSDVGVDGGFDNVALDEISVLNITTSNIIVENTWIAIYYTIANANAIINRIDEVNDPSFTDEEKDNIKGQAMAIRALAHFDLLRMFGEHWDQGSTFGIPVVKTIQTSTDVVPRSSVANSYQAIIDDLNMARALITSSDADHPSAFINPIAVNALLARVYLYKGDFTNAAQAATDVIDDGTYAIMDGASFKKIYTDKFSDESIFELAFDQQNRSAYNNITYSRDIALRTEVLFLVESGVNDFFQSRPSDLRADLVDFVNNDESILPDGRTQKYRGEDKRDNDALIIRMAEIYLIRAEALGLANGGLDDLNTVRTNRGLTALVDGVDVTTEADLLAQVLDERKAELNMEGHRIFDLARTQNVDAVLGADVNPIFPIPYRETIATKGVVAQNPGYDQ